jgi:hypothetical protein
VRAKRGDYVAQISPIVASVVVLALAWIGIVVRAHLDPPGSGTAVPAAAQADQDRLSHRLPSNRWLLLYAGVVLIVVLVPGGRRSSSQLPQRTPTVNRDALGAPKSAMSGELHPNRAEHIR